MAETGSLPLAVDLDGTLSLSDTWLDTFHLALKKSPPRALLALAKLRRDTSHAKRALCALALPDPASFHYRQDLLDWLKAEKARGRKIHLVSAGDALLVGAVAAHIGLFDSFAGSTPGHNLIGPAKLAWMVEHFPAGFDYIGDSRRDIVIWRHTRKAFIAGNVPKITQLLRETDPGIAIALCFPDK